MNFDKNCVNEKMINEFACISTITEGSTKKTKILIWILGYVNFNQRISFHRVKDDSVVKIKQL